MTARPPVELAPDVLGLLLDSPFVEEARLIALNPTGEQGPTGLFAVDGDAERFRAAAGDEAGLVRAEVTPAGDGRFYLLMTFDVEAVPVVDRVFETLTRGGVVILLPVVYSDGRVHARLVGEDAVVGPAVEHLPPAVDVEVNEVGRRGFEPGSVAAALSDRQREVVATALEMGYYERPRATTHEAIAERLGCAPSTVTEHLQRAEAKLVRGVMATVAPGGVDAGR